MTIVERLREFLKAPPLDEDGEPRGTKLLPPLKPEEIAAWEARIGAPLSPECRELVSYCGGLEEGPMEFIEFAGGDVDFLPFPVFDGRMTHIAQDGFGNFWFFWTTAVTPDLGPIYFFEHEGPMILCQTTTLVEFVEECVRFMTPPFKSLIDDVHEFRLKPIRRLNDDLIERDVAIASGDEELRTFAATQPAGCWLYDFRRAKVGDGVDLKPLDLIGAHQRLPILSVARGRSGFARWFLGRRDIKSRKESRAAKNKP